MKLTTKTYLSLFIFLNMNLFSYAQSYDIDEANQLFISKSYYKAIPAFKNLLLTEDNSNINYKLGLCYFNLNKEIESIPYLKKATNDTYKKYSLKNTSIPYAPIDAFYYLAKAQHVNGNIILAFELYNSFYDKAKKNNPLRCKAYIGILQCEIAKNLNTKTTDDVVWNLGDTINTSLEESSPVITLDGETIYFTSSKLRKDKSNLNFKDPNTGSYFKDIYVSHQTMKGSWSEPKILALCKPNQSEKPTSILPNGNQLLINKGNSQNSDIYKSEITNSSFYDLSPFPAKSMNTNSNEIDASLSINEEFIYFSSDRRGGFGGFDLYRLRKLPDGTWSKAMNLGSTINSINDEVSPFIGLDNLTLYFSSNNSKSMGGFDIFMTQINAISKWSTPVNLGIPINSTDDDLYYSTTSNGMKAIFSSDRNNTDQDIYFSQTSKSHYQNVAIFKGKIKTSNLDKIPKGVYITVEDLTIKTKIKTYNPRQSDGVYILNLKPCHTYLINYYYKNKSFSKLEQFISCKSSYQEIHKEIILDVINLSNPTLKK